MGGRGTWVLGANLPKSPPEGTDSAGVPNPASGTSANRLPAEDQEWVVKLSWTDAYRDAEAELIKFARREVNKAEYDEADEEEVGIGRRGLEILSGPRDWTQHLPKVLCSHEFEDYFTGVIRLELGFTFKQATDGNRVLAVLVAEKLAGLLGELEGRERLQGFFDCLRVHRRLWKAGLHHRDISNGNLLYRKGPNGEIYGVLNDWNLSVHPAPEGRDK